MVTKQIRSDQSHKRIDKQTEGETKGGIGRNVEFPPYRNMPAVIDPIFLVSFAAS